MSDEEAAAKERAALITRTTLNIAAGTKEEIRAAIRELHEHGIEAHRSVVAFAMKRMMSL